MSPAPRRHEPGLARVPRLPGPRPPSRTASGEPPPPPPRGRGRRRGRERGRRRGRRRRRGGRARGSEFAGAAQTLGAACGSTLTTWRSSPAPLRGHLMGEGPRELHAYGRATSTSTPRSRGRSPSSPRWGAGLGGDGLRTAHARRCLPEVVSAYANATRRLPCWASAAPFARDRRDGQRRSRSRPHSCAAGAPPRGPRQHGAATSPGARPDGRADGRPDGAMGDDGPCALARAATWRGAERLGCAGRGRRSGGGAALGGGDGGGDGGGGGGGAAPVRPAGLDVSGAGGCQRGGRGGHVPRRGER